MSRIALRQYGSAGHVPGLVKVELVRGIRAHVDQRSYRRPDNAAAQCADAHAIPRFRAPASTLRGRVLDVLVDEGYIRGYSAHRERQARSRTFEIELKYFEGSPVITNIQRVSKPGRRVYSAVPDLPSRPQRSRHFRALDAEGRHVGYGGPRAANVGGEVLFQVY